MFNRKDIWFTLLIGIIIVGFSWCAARTARSDQQLPSQTDVQTRLVSEGYDLVVDGIVGKDTRAAWDDHTMKGYDAQDNSNGFE